MISLPSGQVFLLDYSYGLSVHAAIEQRMRLLRLLKRKADTIKMATNQPKKPGQKNEEEEDIRIDIVRQGEKVIVPENVTLADAVKALSRKIDEEEQTVAVEEIFQLNPLEGALAFHEALVQKFNWVSMVNIPGGIFRPDQPPRYVNIPIAKNKSVQIPVGRLVLPGVDGWVQTGWALVRGRPLFQLTGQVKHKHRYIIQEIGLLTKKLGQERSIYKGKPIRANFPNLEEATSLEDFFPEFMDLSGVDTNSLIFSEDLQQMVNVTLFTPIEKTEACRKHGISLKRGILLEGPFGVGKTLTAHVTAKKCEENGWTFIYIRTVEDLSDAIEYARQYQPAVVFGEDLDQVLDNNDRDEAVNEILNTIDGIDAKGTEIIVVLTTNNVQMINQAMLRPERLDAVIPVRAPDAKAVERLIRTFAKGKINENEDLSEVGKILDGFIPASIHEVVERSKLAAISRTGDNANINANDLKVAANSMIEHLKLLTPQKVDDRPEIVRAADLLGKHLLEASQNAGKNQLVNSAMERARSIAAGDDNHHAKPEVKPGDKQTTV